MPKEKIQKEKLLIIDKELKKTNPVYITVDRYVSKMRLSILAEKLIRAIASNIAEGNCTNLEDISLYTNIETSINTKTFCEIFNYKNDNCFTKLADAREELQYTGFTLPGKCRPTDSLIAKSYVENGNMYFQISSLVLPYYMGKGIDYELINILNFKNVNTFRFYEFLLNKLQDKERIEFILTFEETKTILNLTNKYPKYIDFKSRVLKAILQDINGENFNKENFCNIRLAIETVKNGRKMSGIKFTVTRNAPKEQEPKLQETFNEKIYNKIVSMTPKQQQALFEKTLQNYPDKNAFSYKLLSSKTYEEVINHPGLSNFYIKTLKEQKFVDILMDQF